MNSKPTLVHFIIFFSVLFLICIGIYSIDTDPKTDYSHLAPVGDTTTTELNKHVIKDTVWHYRIVKSVKVDNQTSTSYHYKYDWWNGKLRQQPRVESETKYYIVYKDGGIEETTKEKGMFYEKGDTIKYYTFTYKN